MRREAAVQSVMLFLVILGWPLPLKAQYIDPGSGGILLQVIISIIVSAIALRKKIKDGIISFLKRVAKRRA